MGDNKGLLGLALILGLAGVGLSGYTVIVSIAGPPSDQYIQNSWYKQNLGLVYALPSQEIGTIPNLNTSISVKSGEGVVFYYNGVADLYGWAYMNFWIAIDGITISDSHISLYIGF